jgi:hypothetical protein
MRVIDNPPPAPAGGTVFTAQPGNRESIAVTWSREIAAAVAAALDVDFEQGRCHLVLGRDLPVPKTLHCGFLVAGHRVEISVVWDEPWQEPGFALAVDGQPVGLDAGADGTPAVVLAHAAWQAVTDADSTRPGDPAATKADWR